MGAERYGQVRGYGIGIIPTQLSTVSRFTQESRDGSADVRVRRLEDEIAELRQTCDIDRAEVETLRQSRDADRAKVKTLKQTHDADRAKVETLRRTRDADRAKIQTMRAQLQQLMHMFMPSLVSHYI